MPTFTRYIGIDYSGAETPTASLKDLRVYLADGGSLPEEVLPPPSPRKYWTRKGVAHWLVERLAGDVPTLIGIDHGFSFPLCHFKVHGLEPDWPAFLDDFQHHWPTDEDHIWVDCVRDGSAGNGAARTGNARWRRLTEKRAGGAKSVFYFDVPGQVAKSTHAGIPWLRFIRCELGGRVHFWPLDGWNIPHGRSAIVEVYPALWSHSFASDERNDDQHDAYSIAAWLSRADRDGSLAGFLAPELAPPKRSVARVEGWILWGWHKWGGSDLEVFSQRYERGSILVASNLPFDEWTEIFGIRASHRRVARPPYSPCPYSLDERRELPSQSKPKTAEIPKNACLTVSAMVVPVGPQAPPAPLRFASRNASAARSEAGLSCGLPGQPETPHTASHQLVWFCSAVDTRKINSRFDYDTSAAAYGPCGYT